MDPQTPYRPPSANMNRRPGAAGGSSEITHGMVESLARTRPWVVFLGILMMIGCGLLLLASILMAAMGGVAGMSSELGGLGGAALGGLYLLMALLYFFPARSLLRYGSSIRDMGNRANAMAMQQALEHQASFWRFVGIMAAVITAIYAAVLVVVAIAAVVGLAS